MNDDDETPDLSPLQHILLEEGLSLKQAHVRAGVVRIGIHYYIHST